MVDPVLRQPTQKILRHIVAVVGVGTWLAVLDGDAAVHKGDGYIRTEIPIEDFISEGRTAWCVATGTGVYRKDLARARPIEKKNGIEHLRSRTGLRALASSGHRIIHSSPITHHTFENLTQIVRMG